MSSQSHKQGSSALAETSKKAHFIVGIGASAGGLESFQQFLTHLPCDTGMAFVLVQHLDPTHESHLTEILSKATKMPVVEVKDLTIVSPNHVFIIPPNKEMVLSKGVLRLTKKAQRGVSDVINGFFSSLAEDAKTNAIAIVLSGTGTDGTFGIQEVRQSGGIVFAEDPETAKFNGMPKSAIASGFVDIVLPSKEIAKQLIHISQRPHADAPIQPPRSRTEKANQEEVFISEEELRTVLNLVRGSSGSDLTHYKKTTLMRRIWRRMLLKRIDKISDYIKILEESPAEAKALFQDLLIHVTTFFRDPETYDELKENVFPTLIKNRTTESPIKVWVPGCSTGQEVYSMAIVLMEFLEESKKNLAVQLFGTDISESAIAKARSGNFTEAEVSSVSQYRLEKFFIKGTEGFKVRKSIRDMCIFSNQDVTKDPPFSNLDLISCRNLLIYFETSLQRKVLSLFHYGLKPSGILILGNSETAGTPDALFASLDKAHKIFVKKISSARPSLSFSPRARSDFSDTPSAHSAGLAVQKQSLDREADRAIATQRISASVIVNDDLDILQFRGQTGDFLENAPGESTHKLLKMARQGLAGDLHAAISKARKTFAPQKTEGIRLRVGRNYRSTSIEVFPFEIPETGQRCFVIAFEFEKTVSSGKTSIKKGSKKLTGEEKSEVQHLRRELAAMEGYLKSVIEKEQALIEELKSGNEEILSGNEELQSTNEELETAKEELQSTNEELTTLNDELRDRNDLLHKVNADLENVLISIQIPLFILDKQLRISRFTPMALKAFHLHPNDIGRPINDIRFNFEFPKRETISKVMQNRSVFDDEIQDTEGHWLSMRMQPYLVEGQVEGLVIAFVNVDTLKRAFNLLDAIVETIRVPLFVLDENLQIKKANNSFYEVFKTERGEIENRSFYLVQNKQFDSPELRELLKKLSSDEVSFQDFEMSRFFPKAGNKSILVSGRYLKLAEDEPARILIMLEDITDRRIAERSVEKASSDLANTNKELEQFAYVASHDLQEPLRTIATYMQLLTRKHQELLGPEASEIIDVVVTAAKKMKMLVHDLLQFSKTARADLTYEEIDTSEVVDGVLADLQLVILENNVQVTKGNLPIITADKLLMGQVFQNLITNAIKFRGDESPKITISEKTSEKEFVFCVADNGIGIPKQYADRIFLIFQRLHRSDRYPGTGIGLTTCQRIVERYGGRIWFESEEGKGTQFYFSIPFKPEKSEDHAQSNHIIS